MTDFATNFMTDFDVLRRQIISNGAAPFERGGTAVFTEEYDVEGKPAVMRLTVQSSYDFWFIRDADKSKLTYCKNFLQRKRCADTVIWELTDSGQWVLHIIEMKRTVDDSGSSRGWEHIKSQFTVAYRLCKMVAASLDIEFDQVLFYTAFVNDKISSRTGNISEEDPVTERVDPDMSDDTPSPWTEWASGICRLGDKGWFNNYTTREHPHKKILLTESTNGTYVATGSLVLTDK